MTGLSRARWITENQLDEFARTKSNEAQGVIVELVFRLVAASIAKPKERRFPLGDSVNQPGPDGMLDTDIGYLPFVPEGTSYWEIGTGGDARGKANSDYKDLTASTPPAIRSRSTFVFVTPLSGRRKFPNTWKSGGQLDWTKNKRRQRKWKDVRVIDATRLIEWVMHFPAVERWLAERFAIPVIHTTTPGLHWRDLQLTGSPPPLLPDVFLIGRDDAKKHLEQLFATLSPQLQFDVYISRQVLDFVSAYVAALPDDQRLEILGRCLFIEDEDAWEGAIELRERYVLVIGFDFDEPEQDAISRLQNAKNRGHSVVYGSPPGGLRHQNRVALPSPKPHQLRAALESSGYSSELARTLAEKSGGNLDTLIKLLHRASLQPEWASTTEAAEIAVALFLGMWDEGNSNDKAIAASLAGKTYGEWIGRVREANTRRDTPLRYRHSIWKVVPRYEVWYALAPYVYDELLERFRTTAVKVLGEIDPALDLPKNERYLAVVKGKILLHSNKLRRGIAETVAYLGAMGDALVACTPGKVAITARLIVRETLSAHDWRIWASLDQLLPVLAEAMPVEFMAALEGALHDDGASIDKLFAQEDSGFGGRNYITGVLWSLETLAWDPILLAQVTLALGWMAAKDPGGRWANRPMNSLVMIYLPWLPQTTASLEKKCAAIESLAIELPDQAWKLLLALLPKNHGFSMGSRRPILRSWIPPDRTDEVSGEEFWRQASAYAEICVRLAFSDDDRLAELIAHFEELPPQAGEKIIDYIAQHGHELSELSRNKLWSALDNLILKHRKFSGAFWALDGNVIDRIAELAAQLLPESKIFYLKRLFGRDSSAFFDHDDGDYVEQSKKLIDKRAEGALAMYAELGLDSLFGLARDVEEPYQLGLALGIRGGDELDAKILSDSVPIEETKPIQFASGFARGRFYNKEGWLGRLPWQEYTPGHIVRVLSLLPFSAPVWRQAEALLGSRVGDYWKVAPANDPVLGEGPEEGARKLLEYGRPVAAMFRLYLIVMLNKSVDVELAVRTLLNAKETLEQGAALDGELACRLIEYVQAKAPDCEELWRIEWLYLEVLDKHFGRGPVTLERKLSMDPSFFWELLTLVFRSEHDENPPAPTEQQRRVGTRACQVLGDWHLVPGTHGADIDEQELNRWLGVALEKSRQSGHLSIAQSYIGRVFAHSLRTAGQPWPADPIARILNDTNNESMRSGFVMGLLNMRGVHTWDAGKGEQRLAEKYYLDANELERRHYIRLAAAVRQLGDSYQEDSKREAAKDYD